MNIRSARKFNALTTYFQSLPYSYDVIVLKEAWLMEKMGLQLNLNGYDVY